MERLAAERREGRRRREQLLQLGIGVRVRVNTPLLRRGNESGGANEGDERNQGPWGSGHRSSSRRLYRRPVYDSRLAAIRGTGRWSRHRSTAMMTRFRSLAAAVAFLALAPAAFAQQQQDFSAVQIKA